MASPLSIVQLIIEIAIKIKNVVENVGHNQDDCRRIGELMSTVHAVAEGLKRTPRIMEDGALSVALKGLKLALDRAWNLVAAFQKKNVLVRAIEADNMAVKLRRVGLDISLNLSAVVLANGAYNTSKLANIFEIVEALRADVAYNRSMLVKIMETVVDLPDAHLRLQQQLFQMAGLLQACYSNSTDDAIYENKSGREIDITDVSRLEIKNKEKVIGPTDDPKGPYGYPSYGGGYMWKSSHTDSAGVACYARSIPAHHAIQQGIFHDIYGRETKNKEKVSGQADHEGPFGYPPYGGGYMWKSSETHGADAGCYARSVPTQQGILHDVYGEGKMSSSVIAVKDMNHLEEALDKAKRESKLLVLELMGSYNYSSTCEFMMSILEDKIAPAFKDHAYFYKLDVDDQKFKDVKRSWGVQALPDFVMVKNGVRVNRIVTTDKDQLMTIIRRSL
ncbi:unnamed protein product [Urochloa humidicola]